MSCSPMADATWLSEDIARLVGTFCSKLRRSTSISDSLITSTTTTTTVPKTAIAVGSRGSEGFHNHQRSQSFDMKSSASLRMLQDFCCPEDESLDKSNPYGVYHPHKTRDLGPHRHYYKPIRRPLELKLK
jgi:hypothetical protein